MVLPLERHSLNCPALVPLYTSLVCKGSAGARPSSLAYHVSCHLPFASCHALSCCARAHAGAIFLLLVNPGELSVDVRVHGFGWRIIVSAASLTHRAYCCNAGLALTKGPLSKSARPSATEHMLPPFLNA